MALFNWQEDAGFGCPEGQVWSVKQGQCIPKRSVAPEGSSFLGGGLAEARGNIKANRQDWRCQRGYMWDDAKKECIPIKEWTTNDELSTRPSSFIEQKPFWEDPTVTPPEVPPEDPLIPKESLLPETPPALYENEAVWDSLTTWLTADQSQATEDAYWDTKMTRLREQYDETKDQLMEDLNVKGLYYSGVRADKLQELADDYEQVVAEEEAKFQYERFDRDVQRYGMASQFALGARAQDIQWALGKGQLDLNQLDLALQETLGIRALDLQEKGLGLNFMLGLYQIGLGQEQNDMARQQMWINTVQLLYQMGYSESEVDAAWAQMMGQGTQPAY